MKNLIFVAALAVALPLCAQEQPLLRFYNNDAAVARDVVVTCGGAERTLTIAPHASADVESACTFVAPPDVTAVRAEAAQQWNAIANDSCPAIPLLLPPFGCVSGIASAAVSDTHGATYSWNVDGATILGNSGGSRISMKLGTGDSVKVSVTIRTDDCTTTSNGVIKLTNPLDIRDLAANAGMVLQPVTISWEYRGAATSQTLTGTDFGTAIAIPVDQTSYTYTPITEGPKSVTLTAISEPHSVPPPPDNGGRRRPSQKVPVSATTCGTVTATAQYTVGNCSLPNVAVSVPATVKPGATFRAQVHLSNTDGTAAIKWTITNGSPIGAIDGTEVTIVAGQTGEVAVSVEVRFTDTCLATVRKKVDINGKCSEPTATVSYGGTDCKRSLLKVKFTGQAPFGGTWSDGVVFSSNTTEYTRDVSAPGSFTLRSFHDAVCDGTVSGVANVPPLGRVTISTKGSNCDNATIVAKFEGTPPFTGTWNDDQSTFRTNEFTIEHKPVLGTPLYFVYVGYFRDANCTAEDGWSASNQMRLPEAPWVTLYYEQMISTLCSTPERASIITANVMGDPPIHVKWSDGVVQDLPYTPARRIIWPEGRQSGSLTLSIVEASDKNCPAVLHGPSSQTVVFADWPKVDHPDSDNFMCSGQQSWAKIISTPPPGIPIIWSITNGEIVSGQGTPSIIWKSGAPGSDITINAKYDYGNNDCATTGTALPKPHVRARLAAPVVSIAKTEISAGESINFSVTVDENTEAWGVATEKTQEVTLGSCIDNPNRTHTCNYIYKNTTGAGVKTIIISYYGQCDGTRQSSFAITVK